MKEYQSSRVEKKDVEVTCLIRGGDAGDPCPYSKDACLGGIDNRCEGTDAEHA